MNLKKNRLSIHEWLALTQGKEEKVSIPITLRSTSGSMQPFIRMNVDEVTVVPCDVQDVQPGDILFLRAENSETGFLLHRLYGIRDGQLITIGDHMQKPDRPLTPDRLLGRAVAITGPRKRIDCDRPWKKSRDGSLYAPIVSDRFSFYLERSEEGLYGYFTKVRSEGQTRQLSDRNEQTQQSSAKRRSPANSEMAIRDHFRKQEDTARPSDAEHSDRRGRCVGL